MSEKYPDLSGTNFPGEIDTFTKKTDPSSETVLWVQKCYAKMAAGDIQGAYDIIEAHPELKDSQLSALDYNKLRDAVIAMQRWYQKQYQAVSYTHLVRVYREGVGFVWQSDQNAIDDAQQDYDDALYEKQKSDLEDEKADLEEALEREKEKLQESIDSYEEYKNKWQEITDLYEQAQNQQILNMLFGKDFEQDILNQKEEAYIIFRDKYLAIQEELNDVEKEIEANNKRIEELEKIKEAWTSTCLLYTSSGLPSFFRLWLGFFRPCR